MGAAAIPLVIGSTIFSGVQSASAARQQNRAIRRSQESAREAAEVQVTQVTEQNAVERLRRLRESAQLRGRLRVAAGGSGFTTSGSFARVEQQIDTDLNLNLGILENNLSNDINAIQSGLNVQTATLQGGVSNPLVSAFTGILGGASTGLSIATAGQQLQNLNQGSRT